MQAPPHLCAASEGEWEREQVLPGEHLPCATYYHFPFTFSFLIISFNPLKSLMINNGITTIHIIIIHSYF